MSPDQYRTKGQVCARQRQKLASLPQIRFAFAISASLSFPTKHLLKHTERKDCIISQSANEAINCVRLCFMGAVMGPGSRCAWANIMLTEAFLSLY